MSPWPKTWCGATTKIASRRWPRWTLITASFGVADASAAPTQELLVRLADEALYQAKDDGRDRSVLAESMQLRASAPPRPHSEQRASVDLLMMAQPD